MVNYFAPKTWTTGEPWSASDLNRYLRDDLEAVRVPLDVFCYATAGQTIPNNAGEGFTAVSLQDVVSLSAFLDPNHVSRLVIPETYDGLYFIHGGITYASSGAGSRRDANLRLNGTTSLAKNRVSPPPTGAGGVAAARVEVAAFRSLVAGDYIELGANQDSGGSLSIQSTVDETFLEMIRRRF